MGKKSLRDIGRALEEQHTPPESLFNGPKPHPAGDMLQRLQYFKAKLDHQKARGIEPELTPEEQAELQGYAEAIMEAIQPFLDALQLVANAMVEVFTNFFESETGKQLVRLAEAYAESQVVDETTIDAIPVSGALKFGYPMTGAGGYAFDTPVATPIVRSDSIGLRDAARDIGLNGMRS